MSNDHTPVIGLDFGLTPSVTVECLPPSTQDDRVAQLRADRLARFGMRLTDVAELVAAMAMADAEARFIAEGDSSTESNVRIECLKVVEHLAAGPAERIALAREVLSFCRSGEPLMPPTACRGTAVA